MKRNRMSRTAKPAKPASPASSASFASFARRARTRVGALACALAAALMAACLLLPGCGGSDQPASGGSGSGAAQPAATGVNSSRIVDEDFHNTDIGADLAVESSMELRFAQNFTVDYLEGGYKLICVSDGTRYLTVPAGAEAPADLADDVAVLPQPLSDLYLVASNSMCLFESIGCVDRVSVSGIQRDDWAVEAAVKAMDAGTLVYGGKYNAPDYDLLLQRGVRLAVESTMMNHVPDVKEKLQELGITVLTEQSSYETEPLGRTEWVKLYGALFDAEDKAQAVFDQQSALVDEAVAGAKENKTVAFFYINTNGSAVVRRPGDYVTKMISMAGGTYAFSDLEEKGSGTSTVTLEMEQFYATAKDVDVIIYNATIDGNLATVDELIAKNALLAKFKAVQDGNVWCTDQNMYQRMDRTGAIVKDFGQVIAGTDKDKLSYLYKLK